MDIRLFTRVIIFLNISIITWAVIASPVRDLLYHFQENRLVTYFSAFQLICTALMSFLVFDTAQLNRNQLKTKNLEQQSHYVWLLIALGFLLLSFDEVLMIHEQLDKAIHSIYAISENRWSDRLDDLLILLYCILAIFILWKHRKNLFIYKETLIKYLYIIFLLVLIMVVLDVITNRQDIIKNDSVFQLLQIFEEISKLAAEALCLVMAYACLKQTLIWQLRDS